MTKKKKKANPIPEDNEAIIDHFDYLGNAASTHDCTGLIPAAPADEAELESYEEVYHYLPGDNKIGMGT